MLRRHVALAAIALAGCGGGGSSSNTEGHDAAPPDASGGSAGTAGSDSGAAGSDSGAGGSAGTGGSGGTDSGADAGPCRVVGVSAGAHHTCAWANDGAAWCWGANDRGELGTGTPAKWLAPSAVKASAGFASLAAGSDHTCGVKSNGALWCWGYAAFGQIGAGQADVNCVCVASPVLVGSLGLQVAGVGAGNGHNCALLKDGSVTCFGWNIDGQLGGGTTGSSSSFVPVTTLGKSVSKIAVGGDHACAVKSDGTVWCWGSNDACEIGIGPPTDPGGCFGNACAPTPVQVSGLASVASVAAGDKHTCAVKSDGTLWCWGKTADGEIGDGNTTGDGGWSPACRNVPVQVVALGTDVAEVAAGASHTCARKKDGTVWCWGLDSADQLGDGGNASATCGFTSLPCETTPVQVAGVAGAVAIAAGGDHTCVLSADGTVKCWGDNSDGQVGDGTNVSPVAAPTAVTGLCP